MVDVHSQPYMLVSKEYLYPPNRTATTEWHSQCSGASGKAEPGIKCRITQQEQKLSQEEAIQEVVRIHDADVAEFVALHANLPDFGDWHGSVDKYMLYQGMMIQGLNSWYHKDTLRYHSSDQYAEKEYVRSVK